MANPLITVNKEITAMTIVNFSSIEKLIQSWLTAEEDGEQFPVPFDTAWKVAGYSTRQKGRNKLKYFVEGSDLLTNRVKALGGRTSLLVQMSCEAFKHFCLLSETDEGQKIRRYFVECEKEWKLVQQHRPQVLEGIESKLLDKFIELEKLRLKNSELDHFMLTMHGKEVMLALRGHEDQIIETEKSTIEVIDERHNVRFKGQTLPQVNQYLENNYGIKFESEAEIKRLLENQGEGHLIAQTPRSTVSDYIPEENLEAVYKVLKINFRKMLLGE